MADVILEMYVVNWDQSKSSKSWEIDEWMENWGNHIIYVSW
jgi:hypothetical protein